MPHPVYIVSKLKEFAKEHPYAIGFNSLLALCSPIDDIFIPYLLGRIINNVHKRKNWLTPLIILIAILVSMQVVYTSMYWHDAYVLPKARTYIHQSMLSDIIERYEGTEQDLKMGEVLSRLVKIPATAIEVFQLFKNYLIPYFISFLVTTATIAYYDWVIGLVVFICVTTVFALVLMSPAMCADASQAQEKTQARIDEETEDLLQNLTTVYTSNSTGREMGRLKESYTGFERSFKHTMDCLVGARLKTVLVLGVMMAVFAFRAHKGISNSTMTVGAFVTIITILGQWFSTLGWIASLMRDLVVDWGILRAFEGVEVKEAARLPASTHVSLDSPKEKGALSPRSNAVISTRNLHYVIRNRVILNNLNIDIMPNERIAIVGEIGSGKSTLVKILLGLRKPTAGTFYINGVDYKDMGTAALRRTIGYVPQNPTLFNRPVIENIKYGAPDASDADVMYLIKSLGLSDALLIHNAESNGLQALAGKGGSHLSGGQRQLIACMRALLANPPILVLDEITSSIDRATKALLFNVLNKLFVGKTVIMITHDNDLLSLASRTIDMNEINSV